MGHSYNKLLYNKFLDTTKQYAISYECSIVYVYKVIMCIHSMCIYNVHVVTCSSIPTTYKIVFYTYDYILTCKSATYFSNNITIFDIVQIFWRLGRLCNIQQQNSTTKRWISHGMHFFGWKVQYFTRIILHSCYYGLIL